MKNKLTLFFLLLFFLKANCQESDLFNFSNSIKFADYLYKNGEYSLAQTEFKRVLFLDSSNIQANIKIHDSFIRLGSYKEGLKFSNLYYPRFIFNDTLFVVRGKLLLLNGDFNRLHNEILYNPLPAKELTFLKTSEYIFRKDWESAENMLSETIKYPEFQQLTEIINNSIDIKYKKPVISIAMSAIVPGSGKVYSGYWKDGLFSFLFVGISAWQSYRGFSNKGINSIYGWLMGGISLSFYTGNLYGSVKASNKYNHELDQSILNNFEEVFISTYSNF
jgi:hypothetical protein